MHSPGDEEGRAGCNGDSGGPLVCQAEDGKWYQVREQLAGLEVREQLR